MARPRRPQNTQSSRRKQLLIVAGVAVVAVVALIVVGALLRGSGQQGSASVANIESQVAVDRNTMGSPTAPLTLIEYSDFQ